MRLLNMRDDYDGAAVYLGPGQYVHYGRNHKGCSSYCRYPLCNLCAGASYVDARGTAGTYTRIDGCIPRCAHLLVVLRTRAGYLIPQRKSRSCSIMRGRFVGNNDCISRLTDLYITTTRWNRKPVLRRGQTEPHVYRRVA